MLRVFPFLFWNGLIVGGLGIPVAIVGLPVQLITGSWEIAHFGLWMMGGGFLVATVGGFGMYYFGVRQMQRMFNRFINQPWQREEVIEVPTPPPTELPRH
jgi:hypothetical protein